MEVYNLMAGYFTNKYRNTTQQQIGVSFMKFTAFILLILVSITSINCGKEDESSNIYISGALEVDTGKDLVTGPAFVAIATTDDIDLLQNNMTDYINQIIAVDQADYSFLIDLTMTELAPGDTISIFAFIDNDYNNSIPELTVGDYVGFYFNEDDMATSYILQPGLNQDIVIEVNRRVYDFDAEITGTVSGQAVINSEEINYEGNVLLVAYAGEIGLDFEDFAVEDILGFEEITLSGTPEPFTIDILPYGHNVPIYDVYIIALYDANGNKEVDEGEYIGFYSVEENLFPTTITINEGVTSNINLNPITSMPEPSGYEISLEGSVNKPDEFYGCDDPSAEKVFFLVAKVDVVAENDPTAFMDQIESEPFQRIKHFAEIPWDEEDFEIDLSETDLVPGDTILIAAIWDSNNESGFPNPDKGDFIGFYIKDDGTTYYTLKDGVNSGIIINMNREIFDYDIELRGTLHDGECACNDSDVMVVAYKGEITSFDFADEFDINGVVGFQNIDRDEPDPKEFAVKIFPYGYNIPIEDVYLIAMCDKNGNGEPDDYDVVGFYEDSRGLPAMLTINNYYAVEHWEAEDPIDRPDPLDIEFSMELQPGSGYDVPLTCEIEMPHNELYNQYSKPVYVMIAESTSSNPADILNNSLESIRYFKKIIPPTSPAEGVHTIDITLDLSETTLDAGDNIIVAAIWDLDYDGGFPFPTVGDYIGFYIDTAEFNPVYELKADVNDVIGFQLDRVVYDFEDVSISGTLKEYDSGLNTGGEVTIVAYADDSPVSDFDFASTMDITKVIGFSQVSKFDNTDKAFELDIMPYMTEDTYDVMTHSDEYVYLFAFVDNDENGMPNAGDIIGFHTSDIMPETFAISDPPTSVTNKDIYFIMEYPAAGDYDIGLPVVINLLENHNSNKIYYSVVKSVWLEDLMGGEFQLEAELEMIGYLPGVTSPLDPTGTDQYNFTDCSESCSENCCLDLTEPSPDNVAAGDEVTVFALWDKCNDSSTNETCYQPSGEIPTVDPGDYIGFFIDEDKMSPFYTLKTIGPNDTIIVNVKYKVYDFNASVAGNITGLNGTGDIMVIAYAGELDSFDMNAIDFNKVIGIQQITNVSGPSTTYDMSIMPYFAVSEGTEPPFVVNQNDGVYLIAFQDINGNGVPDDGDMVGAHMATVGSGLYPIPAQLDIYNGTNLTGKNIELMMELSEPAGHNVDIWGNIENPNGVTTGDTLFVILASTPGGSMSAFLEDPMSTMKAIHKMNFKSGDLTDYSINIENTSLDQGDEIAVMAVWDKGYVRGFVNPSAGDCMGFYIDETNMTFTTTIGSGDTQIPDFRIDKTIYNHNCSVRFRFNNDYIGIPADGWYNEGDNVVVTAMHEDGVDITNKDMDVKYIFGMKSVPLPTGIPTNRDAAETYFKNYWYENDNAIPLLPMIYDPSIYGDSENNSGQPYVSSSTGFAINDITLFVILDNAPANGGPDPGEHLGYYYYYNWLLGSMPEYFNVTNIQNTPSEMANRGVRIFTDDMYTY